MKKPILSLLLSLFVSSILFSQSSIDSIKAYPLHDYQSPDIKFRRLSIGSAFRSNGVYEKESSRTAFTFQLNSNLYFYQYNFTNKYQGISTSLLKIDLSSRPIKQDDDKIKSNFVSTYLDYFTQSRIYYPNNAFWGIHTGSYYQFRRNAEKDEDDIQFVNTNELSLTPYISLGKGRVQPVRSARMAMDILISLDKYSRLKHKPSKEEINALAIVANEIEYKRFYDRRYKYIYQLEELDKALQGMDLIDTADIVYFANLNDIWGYGNWQKRGSGNRFEGGLIPRYNALYQNSEISIVNAKGEDKYLDYGLYGFISFNRFMPTSYAWQSDIYVDLTFGKNWSEESDFYSSDFNNRDYYSTSSSWNGMLNFSWQFSYFPNTRTQLSLTPFSSFSYQKEIEEGVEEEGVFGVNTGMYFSAYYYVSQRFRISALASVNYYNDFTSKTPAPFWNTFLYRTSNNVASNDVRSINDVVTRQYYQGNMENSFLGYDLRFSISYAIF